MRLVVTTRVKRLYSNEAGELANYPILYSFRRCPYAMRARMALVYSAVECELREVVLRDKPPSLLEYSPKGTVPVLILSDGTIIEESMDVINYALSRGDPEGLLDTTSEQSDDVEGLIVNNDKDFVKWLTRYKYFERHPEQTQAEYLQVIEENYLQEFEKRLSGHKYIVSDKKTKADLALIPFIRQFAYADKEYFYNCKYKKIIAWLEGFMSDPSFEVVMHKFDQWHEGDEVKLLIAG